MAVTDLKAKEVFAGITHRAQAISHLTETYSEDDLSKKVKIERPWFTCELPKYEYLQQLINHATYHRGKL